MPSFFSKDKAQSKLLGNLEEHFLKVHKQFSLPVGDFPDVNKFRSVMEAHELSKFPKLDLKQIELMDAVLAKEIPKLMSQFPQEGTQPSSSVGQALTHVAQHVSAPQQQPQLKYAPPVPPANSNPGYQQPYPQQQLPAPTASAQVPWAITPQDKAKYDEVFTTLGPQGGLASGLAVRPILERSALPVDVLRQVWTLSDIDHDGHLDVDEFAVAMHLTRDCTSGRPLPSVLPMEVCPPSKRHLVS